MNTFVLYTILVFVRVQRQTILNGNISETLKIKKMVESILV